ncbi:hypothetical protein V1512DRAFT_252905 [Lipomyces arxii]|uniref:uncharacterized protein n=1 Tax=Lipomyces arxii TaxID=56418 RepID=UPI0034CFEE12
MAQKPDNSRSGVQSSARRPVKSAGSNPHVAPYPPLVIRRQLPAEVWASCLSSWTSVTAHFLSQPSSALEGATYFLRFIQSYVALDREGVEETEVEENHDVPIAKSLRRNVFLLLYRQYTTLSNVGNANMVWGFVRLYAKGNHVAVCNVIKHLTIGPDSQPTAVAQKLQTFILERIKASKFTLAELHALQILMRDPAIAKAWAPNPVFMKGLRALVKTAKPVSDQKGPPLPAEVALKVAYLVLIGLSAADVDALVVCVRELLKQLPPPRDVKAGEMMLALVVRTNLVKRVAIVSDATGNVGPIAEIAVSLETVRRKIPAQLISDIQSCFRKSSPSKSRKQKVLESKIRQIKEVFPSLADKYIATLLAAKNNSVEGVLGYLVEQNGVDEETEEIEQDMQTLHIDDTPAYQTEEDRRFDNLEFEPGSIHFGKRQYDDADKMLRNVPNMSDKQKIFDSLRLIYDEDEDERDDTYDDMETTTRVYEDPDMDFEDNAESSAPVQEPSQHLKEKAARGKKRETKGKPWENKADKKELERRKEAEEDRAAENPVERYLWGVYSGDSSVFDVSQRKTKFRAEIKERTKWSDEQIEGWAKILGRDARQRKYLEAKYIFAGNKPIVISAAYAAEKTHRPDSDLEGSDEDSDNDAAPTKNPSRQRTVLPEYQLPTEPKVEKAWGGKAERRRQERERADMVRGRGGGRGGGVGYGPGRGRGGGGTGGGWAHANHNRRDARTQKMRQGMSDI